MIKNPGACFFFLFTIIWLNMPSGLQNSHAAPPPAGPNGRYPIQELLKTHQWYSVDHKDGKMHFVRIRIPGDGNCALHCLRKTRKEFVEKLLNKIKKPSIQKMIEGDLIAANYKPPVGKNSFTVENYREYIQKQLTKSSEYLSFIEQGALFSSDLPQLFTPTDPWEGTLPAAAAVFHLNVRVWSPSENGPSLSLVAKYIYKEKKPFIDMLMLPKSKHFDLLVDANHPEAVYKAIQEFRPSR